MKRGANAMVRPLTDNDWAKGWRIYVDVNRDNVWSDGTDIQVSVGERLPSYISVSTDGTASASSPYLLFDASGYAKTTSGAFSSSTISIRRNDVTGSAVYEQTRRVKIGTSGRMFVCKPASGTDASCAATGD
jgi:type IV fimbrial biogenesis protein FimT